MCEFKPGDEVVCVRGPMRDPERTYPEVMQDPIVGETYTVRSVEDLGEEGIAIFLEGLSWTSLSGQEGGYHPHRFRPVAKRSYTLSINDFLVIKDGFEEPRRVVEPVKEGVA